MAREMRKIEKRKPGPVKTGWASGEGEETGRRNQRRRSAGCEISQISVSTFPYHFPDNSILIKC